MSDVAANYDLVMKRIEAAATRSGRDPSSIRLIAVTKTVSADRIREAAACGITHIGENRLQEAAPKRESLADLSLTWHFIGHLQTNKAKKVAESFDWIQSVDRAELAERLNDYAPPRRLPILLEVKLGNEATKSGIDPAGLAILVNIVRRCPNIDLCGFMTVPPYSDDPESVRPWFRALRERAKLFGLQELSMGMSHDFEVAIEEGATMVRIGTALFGARR
jgi:PLP dependent protein